MRSSTPAERPTDRAVAVVTGAAGGIGAATVRTLLARGDAVLCVDRDHEGLDALSRCLGRGDVAFVEADLDTPGAARRVVEEAQRRWGRIDSLCLVAGVGQLCRTEQLDLDRWDRVLGTNLRSPFALSKECLPELLKTKGNIVAVSSVAGMQGWAYSAAYSASKAGLIGLMRSLAAEYGGSGVRFNVVAPGGVATAMASDRQSTGGLDHTLRKRSLGLEGRRAEPQEIADVVAYLTSARASFVNGAVLPVDGGAFA